MRTILALVAISIGLVHSGAALAGSGARGGGAERLNKNYYAHKKHYHRAPNTGTDEPGANVEREQPPARVAPSTEEATRLFIVASEASQGRQ